MKPHAFTEYKCLEKWSYNILFNSNENIHLVMYLPVLRICFVQFINTIHIKLLFHNSTMLLLRGDSEGQHSLSEYTICVVKKLSLFNKGTIFFYLIGIELFLLQ